MGSQCLFKRKNKIKFQEKQSTIFYKNEKKNYLDDLILDWDLLITSQLHLWINEGLLILLNSAFMHFTCCVSSENPHFSAVHAPGTLVPTFIYSLQHYFSDMISAAAVCFLFSLLSRLRRLLVALTWQNILDQYWYLTQQDCLFGQGSEVPKLEFWELLKWKSTHLMI